jgi:hypothetical protein
MEDFSFTEPEEATFQVVINMIKGSLGSPFGNVRSINRESLVKICLAEVNVPGQFWSQGVVPHFMEIVGDPEPWEATRCGIINEKAYKQAFGDDLRKTHVKVLRVPIVGDKDQKKPIDTFCEVEIGAAGSEEYFKSIGGRGKLIARTTGLGEATVLTMTMDQNHGLADFHKSQWNAAWRTAALAHVTAVLTAAHDKKPDIVIYSSEPVTPRNSFAGRQCVALHERQPPCPTPIQSHTWPCALCVRVRCVCTLARRSASGIRAHMILKGYTALTIPEDAAGGLGVLPLPPIPLVAELPNGSTNLVPVTRQHSVRGSISYAPGTLPNLVTTPFKVSIRTATAGDVLKVSYIRTCPPHAHTRVHTHAHTPDAL